jgi:large subunit ribosomal protein L9
MKVLLTKDVFNLGHAGDVKTVADGYGRNFLLPRGLAVIANSGVIKSAERIKAKNIEVRARNRADVDAQAAVLNGTSITLHARSGEKGKLFGSITAGHIAAELSKKLGSEFDKRKVALREPIREVGTFTVPVRLATDVAPNITVTVLPEGVIESSAQPVAEVVEVADVVETAAAE